MYTVCVYVFVLRGVYKSRITLLICLIKRKGTKSLLKTQLTLFKWITTNTERISICEYDYQIAV